MKKTLTFCTVLVLALAVAITMAACGKGGKSGGTTTGKDTGTGGGGNPGDPTKPIVIPDVTNETEWTGATNTIKNSKGGNYTINVTDNFSLPGIDNAGIYTFGDAENITVTITGSAASNKITRSSAGYLFHVGPKQTLIIKDIALDGNRTDIDKHLVYVDNASAAFIMQGTASVTGANSSIYSAIEIRRGAFTMEDSSTVYGNVNRGLSGGGVTISNGTFTMKSSSKIYNNTARDGGGGVYVADGGTFIMQDYTEIYGNSSTYATDGGGGVLVKKGSFTMEGNAKIYNNTAKSGIGGGVSVAPSSGDTASFTMEGGEIYGNNTTTGIGFANKGGGVSVSIDTTTSNATASFRMVGGTIYGTGATDKSPNTVDTGGTGAALYVTGTGTTAQTSSGAALTTSETTIKVSNGAVQ